MTPLAAAVIFVPMQAEIVPCRLCRELEIFLRAAERPTLLVSGLSEAAKRNRDHQREERIAAAKQAIARHRKSAHAKEDLSSVEDGLSAKQQGGT